MHTDVLSSSRIEEKTILIHCAQRTLHPFCVVSHSLQFLNQVHLPTPSEPEHFTTAILGARDNAMMTVTFHDGSFMLLQPSTDR